MRLILKDGNIYIIRFDAGEELISELASFCTKEKIKAGTISGIGSSDNITISFYNLDTKQYEDVTIERRLEIVSLSGTIALLNNAPFAHIHGIFSDADMQPVSGHVKKLIVSATAEIILTKLNGELHREHDIKTGLNLLS